MHWFSLLSLWENPTIPCHTIDLSANVCRQHAPCGPCGCNNRPWSFQAGHSISRPNLALFYATFILYLVSFGLLLAICLDRVSSSFSRTVERMSVKWWREYRLHCVCQTNSSLWSQILCWSILIRIGFCTVCLGSDFVLW